jgi:hypothetical protein
LSSAARGCSQASDNQKSWNRWGFQFRAGDSLAAARPQRRTSSRRRIRPSASARVPSPVPLVLYSFNFSRSSPVEINPELPYFHLFSRTSGTSETHSHLRPLSTRQSAFIPPILITQHGQPHRLRHQRIQGRGLPSLGLRQERSLGPIVRFR